MRRSFRPRTLSWATVLCACLGIMFVLVVTIGLDAPPTVAAASVSPLAILIENGAQFEQFNDPVLGMVAFQALNRNIFAIENGQKTSTILGHANILVWSRSLSDPFFAPFGPLAGLGVLWFAPFNLQVNLGLFQDSSGAFQTTISARSWPLNVAPDPTVHGTWLIANGADFGGSATDLVIGGLWFFGPATPATSAGFALSPQFSPGFASDPSPITDPHCVPDPASCQTRLGSFYGHTTVDNQARPVRSYTMEVIADGLYHLLVAHLGGANYAVVACYNPVGVADCTLSGVGSLATTTGAADYAAGPVETTLNVSAFQVP